MKKVAKSIPSFTPDNGVRIILKARLLLVIGGRILLLQQRKPVGGKYTLVGGTVEHFETIKESLIREVNEEAGIQIKKSQLTLAHTLFKKKKNGSRIVLYFSCSNFKGTPSNNEPKKFKSVSWHKLKELPNPMSPTVAHVLSQLDKNISYSELDFTK